MDCDAALGTRAAQIDRLACAHTSFFTTEVAEPATDTTTGEMMRRPSNTASAWWLSSQTRSSGWATRT